MKQDKKTSGQINFLWFKGTDCCHKVEFPISVVIFTFKSWQATKSFKKEVTQ